MFRMSVASLVMALGVLACSGGGSSSAGGSSSSGSTSSSTTGGASAGTGSSGSSSTAATSSGGSTGSTGAHFTFSGGPLAAPEVEDCSATGTSEAGGNLTTLTFECAHQADAFILSWEITGTLQTGTLNGAGTRVWTATFDDQSTFDCAAAEAPDGGQSETDQSLVATFTSVMSEDLGSITELTLGGSGTVVMPCFSTAVGSYGSDAGVVTAQLAF